MKLPLLFISTLMMVFASVHSMFEPFTGTRAGLRGTVELAETVHDAPPLHWFTGYLKSHSGPIDDIVQGNVVLPQKYALFIDRVAAIDIIRKKVLNQRPELDAHDRVLLLRPFYKWKELAFKTEGTRFHVENPHELNRLTLTFQRDRKAIMDVERLVFELLSNGTVR